MDEPSTTPQLDEVPRGLRLLMRLSVAVAGACAAAVSLLALLVVLRVLHGLGLEGAIANMLMMLLSPGVVVAGVVAAVRMERLQERRLQRMLAPAARLSMVVAGRESSAAISVTGHSEVAGHARHET